MAKNKEEKTNVMRTLEQKKIPYTAFSYDPDGPIDGVSVAAETGLDAASVFKTLVTKGASGAYYCLLYTSPPVPSPPGALYVAQNRKCIPHVCIKFSFSFR